MKAFFQKDAAKIGLYVVCVLVLGAIIAPMLFNLGRAVAAFRIFQEGGEGLGGWLHKVLKESDFKRYFNRAVLIAALICLWPLLKSLKVRRADMALEPNAQWRSHFGIGFTAAATFLLMMGGVYVLMGIFKGEVTIDAGTIVSITASALAAGALEEFFFRGALTGIMLRTAKPLTALLVVAAFYSFVHFLKPPDLKVEDSEVGWGSGFWMIGQVFARFGNPVLIAAEFATLFAVGLVLGIARMRTRSLWLAFGLHAGWIFSLKLYEDLTRKPMDLKRGEYLPWVGDDLKIGIVPLVVVALTGWLVFRLLAMRSKPGPEEAVAAATE